MVLAEPARPGGKALPQGREHAQAGVELHSVLLAVVETDRLDRVEPVQRPGEARRRILPAGEEYERRLGHGQIRVARQVGPLGPKVCSMRKLSCAVILPSGSVSSGMTSVASSPTNMIRWRRSSSSARAILRSAS